MLKTAKFLTKTKSGRKILVWVIAIILLLIVLTFSVAAAPFFVIMDKNLYFDSKEQADKATEFYKSVVKEVDDSHALDSDCYEACIPIKNYYDLKWSAVFALDFLDKKNADSFSDKNRITSVANAMATVYTYTQKDKTTVTYTERFDSKGNSKGVTASAPVIEKLKVIDTAQTYSGDIKILWGTREEKVNYKCEVNEKTGCVTSCTWQIITWPDPIYTPEQDVDGDLIEIKHTERIANVCKTFYPDHGTDDADYVLEILRNNDYLAMYGEEGVNEINERNRFVATFKNADGSTVTPTQTVSNTGEYTGETELGWPVPSSKNVTCPFGMRIHPITGKYSLHTGVDIAAPLGSPVVAAEDGVVYLTGYQTGNGNVIIIDHGGGLFTLYAHQPAGFIVKPGDRVKRGQLIGHIGMTGWTTGPHLHFEVRPNGVTGSPVDPLTYKHQ